ncbi:CDP-alcohol phosphatidyltransferase family protein [Alteribacillus iranensis]|uniref:Phosphatidylglycerophosphate synthase n=1 Tax=Alteribacillus iranensis TaxID=930128 RepID=A0A1I2E8C2_9BACI|nr:CDP-alcohol phosphatidyltransferase family protein [Alteribacillus iranensis]SFE89192.1 Phosphatidylglycerophosphate synthase [Alteribacillus iranensis]
MLDTHARKYVEPFIYKSAATLSGWGLTANQVTVIGFGIGVSAGVFVYFEYTYLALITLWLSGFLDAVDGAIARQTQTSPWGTLLDIIFDRLVELGIIIGLAFRFPDAMWALLLLTASIVMSMTVFLTVGALTEKSGMKSFYYQAGLAERSETFILFSFMIVLTDLLVFFTLLFFFMILITAGQRVIEAKRIL